MDLDNKERFKLYNQFKILKKLYPDEAKTYERFCLILENGYKKHYRYFNDWFSDELEDEVANEVYDILDMFRRVTDSLQNLDQQERQAIDVDRLKFKGFDLNNEGNYYSYSKFLIEEDNRYYESKLNYYNSHSPMLPIYRPMVDFVKANDARILTSDQLNDLANI